MSRFLLILLLVLLIIFLMISAKKVLKKRTKFVFWFVFFALIIFAVFWEIKVSQTASLSEKILLAFNQNKTLVCKDFNVSKKDFNYEFGTSSFVSKNKSEFLIIPLKNCEIIDEKLD